MFFSSADVYGDTKTNLSKPIKEILKALLSLVHLDQCMACLKEWAKLYVTITEIIIK